MENKKKFLTGILIGVGLAIIIAGTFLLGIFVGKTNHRFFPYWEKRFRYNDYFPMKIKSHGTVGTINSLGKDSFIIKENDGALKTVVVDKNTLIRRGRLPIKFSDLKEGKKVIVLGQPDDKEKIIKAYVIRVF